MASIFFDIFSCIAGDYFDGNASCEDVYCRERCGSFTSWRDIEVEFVERAPRVVLCSNVSLWVACLVERSFWRSVLSSYRDVFYPNVSESNSIRFRMK